VTPPARRPDPAWVALDRPSSSAVFRMAFSNRHALAVVTFAHASVKAAPLARRQRRALPCEALPPRRTLHACRSRWFKPHRPRAGEAVVRAASDRRAAQAPRQWRPAVRRCHRRRLAIDPTTTLGLWRGAQRESSSCVLADNGWLEGKSCVYRGVHRVTAGVGHGPSRRRPGRRPAPSAVRRAARR
jgi:hypothetical protein